MRKIVLIAVGVVLTSFGMSRVEGLATHRGYAGSVALAQSLEDSTSADAIDSHAAPPNVSGSYSGSVQDHARGAGSISVDLTQTGSKLSGTWETDLDGGLKGPVSGKVKPNGKLHLKFAITIHKHCALNFQGIFENGDEISGVYQTNGCHTADHGMVDIFD